MKPIVSFGAALAALLLATPALAENEFPHVISVTGESSVSVPPDLAQIDAGVASDAKTAKEAADANNAAMSKVLAALKGTGIDEKDYQTLRLSLQPQYAPPAPNKPGQTTLIGYRASNHVTIKVRDLTKVASVIDTLVTAGANDISNVGFTVQQPSKLLDEAREKAVADARRKAEVYAKAAGVELGAAWAVSENGNAAIPMFRRAAVVSGGYSNPPPIAQGEETLSVSVNVVYAIKQTQ